MFIRIGKKTCRIVFALVITTTMGTAANAVPIYNVTDIGTLAGNSFSTGTGINDNGQVSGWGNIHAYIGSISGLTDIGTFGGLRSQGFGINNNGQTTGSANDVTGRKHPFSSDATTNVLTNPGATGVGYAINDSGQLTGRADIFSGPRAFITDATSGAITVLGTLGGGSSVGRGINNNGQVAGISSISGNTTSHAFITDATTNALTDLGTLGGSYSEGNAINDIGQVTGLSTITGNTETHAFITNATTNALTDLGTLGGTFSQGFGINNSGQVVGSSDITNGGQRYAFLWDSGTIYDLNSLIDISDPLFGSITLQEARDINSFGDIIVNGINSSGQSRAFILTAQRNPAINGVPEPAPITLLGLGLLGLIFKRKRK